MTRFLLSILGPLVFLAGLAAGAFWYFQPPASATYWLILAGLLLFGVLAILLGRGWRLLLACSILGLLLISGGVSFLWPHLATPKSSISPGNNSEFLVKTVVETPKGLIGKPPKGMQPLLAQPGLRVSLFAAGLEQPRMLAFSPNGDLYASLPRAGKVVVLPDRDRDGIADRIQPFADRLSRPHGLAFADGDLIVAESNRLVRLPDRNNDLTADRLEVISEDLPAGGSHWTRSVTIAPQGDFMVAAGSSCNLCLEKDARRAAILRIPPSGGAAQIFARGLRNSVGLAFHPETGELWASNNGRDRLGDDLPPEEINRIVFGGDYGWPYCYGQRIPDPDYGSPDRCRDTLPPAVEMQAHSAPLGIVFGHQLAFPKSYRRMLYVAFHGSWNRSIPTGYKLVGIPFDNGRPSGPPQDIVTGWLRGRKAWGRPVAPAVGSDGALYLSDDRAGVIYRIVADQPREGPNSENP